jgi:hypothetical protein
MADNVAVTAGSGTTIAADDVGGVLHQRVKISQGADGSATDVSSAAPLQVTLANTGANATPVVVDLGANNDVTVTGSVTADLGVNNDVTVTNATAANLKAEVVGTGTFVTQVDGSALTALQLIDDVVYVDDTATHSTGSSKGVGIMAAATPTDGSVSANDIGMVAMTTDRKLHVAVMDALPAGSATIGVVDLGATDNAVLDTIASETASSAADLATIAAASIDAGTAGTPSADVLTVQGVTSMTPILTQGAIVDDAAFTPATSRVEPAGFFADETATDSVDEGDAGAARMTLDRKQIVTVQPHTAGGLSMICYLDLDEGACEVVKASAGQLYSAWVTNRATSTRYVKFYNATSQNVGTGTPDITIGIPGNSTDDIGAVLNAGGHGIAFGTGSCVGASTGFAAADTGAPDANDVIITVFYK